MRGRAALSTRAALLLAVALAAGVDACGPSAPRSPRSPTVPHTGITLPGEFEATATILEDRKHGPQLCLGGVATSLPPQCGGIDVVNWDWAKAPSKQSRNGTTWTAAHVQGVYDGRVFRLTQPPGPPQPEPPPTPGADFSPGCPHPAAGTDPHATEPNVDLSPIEQWVVAAWVSDPANGAWKGPFTYTLVVTPGHAKEAEQQVRESYQGDLCVVERDSPTRAELSRVSDEVVAEAAALRMVSSSVDERRGVVDLVVVVATEDVVQRAYQRWGERVRVTGALRPVAKRSN